MIKSESFKNVTVKSAKELRKWLQINHGQKESIWLITYKKNVPDKYISVSEVLDELLCFGWIDGIKRKLDDDKTMQLISPRKTNHWTNTYKERFAKLEKEGKMTDAGRAAIQLSKEKNLWNYMKDVDALTIPDDFTKELNKHPSALQHFKAFGESSQRFTLRWIKLAKTPSTRNKRILQAALLASENKKIPGL